MSRIVYIVAPTTTVDAAVLAAAGAAGATEIARGLPPRIAELFPNPQYPFAYTEPDDPEGNGLRLAALALRNTFKQTRTPAQIDNALDAITLILRRVARNEMDRM